MVIINGYTTTPNQRQNRRRERPGSRTRRTITRKSAFQSEYAEGLLDALDYDVQLPSDKTRPSPLLRQNFDQSWQRWKARETEEKALALAEMKRVQLELEQEHLKLFGGDIDDDELYRRGILYDNESKTASSSVVELATPSPLYILRQAKPRRSRRRPVWQSIPLTLSLSNLRDDYDIARLLSPQSTAQIQHRPSHVLIEQTPLSLPTSSASALSSSPSAPGSSDLNFLRTSIPPHSLEPEDWTFITTQHNATLDSLSSPASEPETWILLSDDLQQIDSH